MWSLFQAKGFLQPGREQRMGSRLHAEGFDGPGWVPRVRALLRVAGFLEPRVETQPVVPFARFGAGDGASVPGAAATPTHLWPAEPQEAPGRLRRQRRVGKPAAQRGKPRLAQGSPRQPFQTRDARVPRGTRAPPAWARPTAGRFVRLCHPKPDALPRARPRSR